MGRRIRKILCAGGNVPVFRGRVQLLQGIFSPAGVVARPARVFCFIRTKREYTFERPMFTFGACAAL